MILSCNYCGNLFGEYDVIAKANQHLCPYCNKANSLLNIEQRIICVANDLNSKDVYFECGQIYEVTFEYEKAFEVIDHNKTAVFVYKHEINKYFNKI
jgi:glutaredoxin